MSGGKDEAKEQAAKEAAEKKAQRRQELKEQRYVFFSHGRKNPLQNQNGLFEF